jgi:hypothetical protein
MGTPVVTLEEIKNKKLKYDYYGSDYIMAEYIDDSNDNNYKITITGLEPGFDFVTYIYI